MKCHAKILICYIGYVTIKDLKDVKICSVNSLYLIFRNVNGYFKEINKSKYLMLVPTNGSKARIKKYEELSIENRYLIRSRTKDSDDYDEKYMKINCNSDEELLLSKTTEIPTITIVLRAISLENNKYYAQVFLDEYLHKL